MRVLNPFFISGKIPSEYFCDRRDESTRLSKYLLNGHNVLLTSKRRMGKTSLINHIYSFPEIADNFNTFFIDILQTNSLSEFTYLLGKEIFNVLKPRGRRVVESFLKTLKSISGKLSYDAISGIPSFDIHLGEITHPEYFLSEIFEYIEKSDSPCIIAIDEFQQICRYPEKNIEAILRTYVQRLTNARFIFAGSEQHILLRMFSDNNRPFYNSASMIHLEAIPVEEYSKFVIKNFESANKRLKREEVDYVYSKMEGLTFYMQKAFNLAYLSTPSDTECNHENVVEAIEEIIASSDLQFRELLSRLTENRKKVLIALSAREASDRITSAEFIQRNALGSASIVQASVKRLIADGIVVRNGNFYSISDQVLRLWLQQIYG